MHAIGSLLQRILWTAAKITVGPQLWYFYSTCIFDPLTCLQESWNHQHADLLQNPPRPSQHHQVAAPRRNEVLCCVMLIQMWQTLLSTLAVVRPSFVKPGPFTFWLSYVWLLQENVRPLDSGWEKMSEAVVMHYFSTDQIVADRCYQLEHEWEAFPNICGYCF